MKWLPWRTTTTQPARSTPTTRPLQPPRPRPLTHHTASNNSGTPKAWESTGGYTHHAPVANTFTKMTKKRWPHTKNIGIGQPQEGEIILHGGPKMKMIGAIIVSASEHVSFPTPKGKGFCLQKRVMHADTRRSAMGWGVNYPSRPRPLKPN